MPFSSSALGLFRDPKAYPMQSLASPSPVRSAVEDRPVQAALKRLLDIFGSLAGLLLLAPLLLFIAVAVKLSSPGPALFRQQRIGYRGKPFVFYKFRSMRDKNDAAAHEKFMAALIAGEMSTSEPLKITNDPRVTPLGRFLRRSSFDELPQLFNVLIGDMSLVGPRPAIAYEVERYAPWHRRRLYCALPGITGLWQVKGRSQVTFDEMVQMDLQYGENWSLWSDIRILAQTPRAVVTGHGAH